MIPYGRQDITQSDIDVVLDVLRSEFLTQGPAVQKFETDVAAHVGAKYAVALNSATSALHVACMALGLGPGDRFWTVPNTFVASANCGLYCGAEVDFVDIDPLTWNISVPGLREKLARAKREARLPKVLVPVHFAGQPTEQAAIWQLAQEYGFKVLEDASHAIGASRAGEAVGNCRWSDITVFSFHPVKIITTGEGGMVLTNDEALFEKMAMLRSHGITRESSRFMNEESRAAGAMAPPWYYEQQMLGYNYRMTDIQAALGSSQLRRLDAYIDTRNQLARRYDDLLRDLPLQLPTVLPESRSAFHLYVVRLKAGTSGAAHEQTVRALRDRGIGVNLHYMPVHLQPFYRLRGFSAGQFPEAEEHARRAFSIPLYSALTEDDQNAVVRALEAVL